MALLVCRLSSAEDRLFSPFFPLPGISCPEQPQVYLGKTPYSLDAWGRGGIAWSAADLTKTPLPKASGGPRGTGKSGLRLPAQGAWATVIHGSGEPWGQKGVLGNPNWSSPLRAPGFPTAKPAGCTGRPPEPAALDLDVAPPPGHGFSPRTWLLPVRRWIRSPCPSRLSPCSTLTPLCSCCFADAGILNANTGVPARRGVHSTRLLTRRGP